MPGTAQDTNGTISPTRPGRPRNGDEKGRSVPLDEEHSRQLDEWIGWYYPSGAANFSVVIHEMMDIAHALGKADNQRAETPEARRGRLAGKGRS